MIRFDGSSEASRIDLRSPLVVAVHEPSAPQYVLDTKKEVVQACVRLTPMIAEGRGVMRIVLRAEIDYTLHREVVFRPKAAVPTDAQPW